MEKPNKASKIKFSVIGMHCASCAFNIEESIKEINGVKSCKVNYANEKAYLEIDSNKVSINQLNEKIKPLGYSFENHMNHNSQEHQLFEANKLKKDVFIGLFFMVITIIVMTWDILAKMLLIPMMPEKIENLISILLPMFATYTMFVIGKRYINGVINFIKNGRANMDTLVGIGTFPILALISFASIKLSDSFKSGLFYKSAGFIILYFAIINFIGAIKLLGLI